jgi:hypothetical protein
VVSAADPLRSLILFGTWHLNLIGVRSVLAAHSFLSKVIRPSFSNSKF